MTLRRLLWVAGGRDYTDEVYMRGVLEPYGPEGWILITGAQRGADLMAERLWRKWEHPYVGVPAKWGLRGRRAGPDRNLIIARDYKPLLLLHFPGGSGTADAVKKAEQFDIRSVAA